MCIITIASSSVLCYTVIVEKWKQIKPIPPLYYRKWVNKMPVSKKQQKSVQKYVSEKYDRIMLTMPKGKKSDLQAHAESKGESLNGFVNRAIDSQIAQDNAVDAFTIQPEEVIKA